MMQFYQTGFYVSIAVAVIGAVLTVTLFFRFHIPQLWAIRSGKAQRIGVDRLEKASRLEGRMLEVQQAFQEERVPTEKMAGTDKADITVSLPTTPLQMFANEQPANPAKQNGRDGAYQTELLAQSPLPGPVLKLTQHVLLVNTDEIIDIV